MHKTNFLKLLKKLSNAQLRRFRDYVDSPFFNKNEKVKLLCDLIYEYAPDFEKEGLAKKALFPKLFHQRSYNRLPINNVVSDLQQLLLDFLAYEHHSKSPDWNLTQQMEALQPYELPILIEQKARRYQQIQEKSKHRSADFFWKESDFYNQLDQLFLSQQKRGYDENLQKRSDALDLFYLTSKLEIACDMESRNTITGTAYSCHFLEEIRGAFFKQKIKQEVVDALEISTASPQHLAPIIYQKVLEMLKNRHEETNYFQLKKLLDRHHPIFPDKELAGIYAFVLNYCVQKINFGKKEFDHEILELYQTLLQRKLIFKNGFLTQWTFRNIVTIGIRTGAFDWTEQFILNYQNQLLPEEKENAVSYNLATLYFSKKDYKNALLSLQKVFFTDNFYQIGAKTIQLKCYFELDEMEALLALATAFNRYLRRHRQLSEYHKELNLNFVKMTKKIYLWQKSKERLSRKMFSKKGQELKGSFLAMERMANKDWLELKFGGI